jgi:hypothetical protein
MGCSSLNPQLLKNAAKRFRIRDSKYPTLHARQLAVEHDHPAYAPDGQHTKHVGIPQPSNLSPKFRVKRLGVRLSDFLRDISNTPKLD